MNSKSHFITNLALAGSALLLVVFFILISALPKKEHPTIEIKSAFPISLVTNTEPKVSVVSILVTPPFFTISNRQWIYFDMEDKQSVCIFNLTDKEWNILTNKYRNKITTNEINFFDL